MVQTYPIEVFTSFKDANTIMPPSIVEYNNKKRKIIRDNNQIANWRHHEARATNKFVAARMSQTDNDKLYDSIRNKLNKLSKDNFDDMVKELLELPITSLDNITELVNIIVDKAVAEKLYVSLYAKLCKEFMPYVTIVETKKIAFRDILISKCQNYYTTYTSSKNTIAKEIKIGFMSFLGYLYVEQVIIYKIVSVCINNLICNYTTIPNSIELLTTLIKIVGSLMARERNGEMKEYMRLITEIKSKNLQLRDKFMIMDLIDLVEKEQWNL